MPVHLHFNCICDTLSLTAGRPSNHAATMSCSCDSAGVHTDPPRLQFLHADTQYVSTAEPEPMPCRAEQTQKFLAVVRTGRHWHAGTPSVYLSDCLLRCCHVFAGVAEHLVKAPVALHFGVSPHPTPQSSNNCLYFCIKSSMLPQASLNCWSSRQAHMKLLKQHRKLA